MYITEAHAVDVWPIGLSAGVLNYSHKTISDRGQCCSKMIEKYDFKIKSYLDNMDNELQNELSAWPFRYYTIERDITDESVFRFTFIPEPNDSQYDLSSIIENISL